MKTFSHHQISQFRELITYDPKTGLLKWAKDHNCVKAGSLAGGLDQGYIRIQIHSQRIKSHRLAWVLFYGQNPNGIIDHVNGDRSDNRIENLRIANFEGNSRNSKRPTSNKSGVKGVSWVNRRSKWVAQIKVSGKSVHLGYFDKMKDAQSAYIQGGLKYHGDFARGQ